MARPTITGKTIVVQVENDLVVWTDGLISSDNLEYIKTAKWLSEHQTPVDLTIHGPTIISNLNDKNHPEQALAAILGIIPGRGRVLQIPDSILPLLPYQETNDNETAEENIWIDENETTS